MDIEIRNYQEDDFDQVYKLVHETIENVYPLYYPRGAVNFFHDHHNEKIMKQDFSEGSVLVAVKDSEIIGTGTLIGNKVKRLFVKPEEQGQGCGRLIMEELESIASKNGYLSIELYASLSSFNFYLKRGYSMKEYKAFDVKDNEKLCCFLMHKHINF